MSKGLEALERIKLKDFILNDDSCLKDIKIIEKELKALEIIKEHIKIDSHKYESEETYGLTEYMIIIPKEEYELLKEVLL